MTSRFAVFALLGIGAIAGCGASGSDDVFNSQCAQGDCDGGAPALNENEAGAPRCDDGVCSKDTETCRTCPRDCGECPTCEFAPSCTDAVGVPSHPTLRPDLNQGVDAPASDAGDGGTTLPTGN